MTTDPTPSTTTAREATMTENQPTRETPAADPTPGPSAWRTDQHGGAWVADMASLLAERDDLTARLATAEAEVERLRERALGDEQCCGDVCNGGACEGCLGCQAGWCVNGHDFPEGEWERLDAEDREQWWDVARDHNVGIDAALKRAEVAERQVQAGLAVLDGHDHADTCGAVLSPGAKYPCSCWKADLTAALAPLDPDAPTGHDGNGAPDTHQGDTEAACSTCAYLERLRSMNPSESLRRDIVEVRDRHMAEAHQAPTSPTRAQDGPQEPADAPEAPVEPHDAHDATRGA